VVRPGKIGAIIQARVMSRRFPGKVLLSLPYGSGISIIENIVLRVGNVPGIKAVIVATSDRPENEEVVSVARSAGAEVLRGSEDDVLDRFHEAAILHGLGQIVRLTADNPFIDPAILDACLETHEKCEADYTKTIGLPLGMNLEVISFSALERLKRTVILSDELEHVTLHMNRNPTDFTVCTLDLGKPEYEGLRLTVDWEADYALACFIYEQLHGSTRFFNIDDIISLLKKYPWAKLINSNLKME